MEKLVDAPGGTSAYRKIPECNKPREGRHRHFFAAHSHVQSWPKQEFGVKIAM
jgi:hypothetical protein